MKRKAGRIVLVSLLAGSMMAVPVYAEPGSIDELQQQKAAADSEVNALESKLLQLIDEVDRLEADMVLKGLEVEQSAQELAAAREKEQRQYEDMKLRIKYMYEEGDASFVQKLLEAESIADLLNQADFIQKVHSYDREMLEEYVKTKDEVAGLKQQRETELKEMQELQTEYAGRQENLNAELTAAEEKSAGFGEKLQAALEAEAARKAAEEAQKAAEKQAEATGDTGQANDAVSQMTDENQQNPSDHYAPSDPSSGSSGDAYEPPASSGSGQAVADYGCNFIGNPYVWGGESLTNGCDCSGFVMSVYAHFGVYLDHGSSAQRSAGYGVSYSQALPGDIICYAGHVGIYIGGGRIVNAIDEAHGIGISSATYAPILAVRRIF